MRIVWILVLAAAALWSVPAHALDPQRGFRQYVRNGWSIQQGLPQISALAMAQDRTGYLWVGTQSGLARFDGVRFTTFTPENEPQLPGIWVRAMTSGPDGRLWIATYKGLAFHDGRRFHNVPASDESALDVAAVAIGADRTVWAATSNGLYRVQGERLRPVAGSPPQLHALWPERGQVWVGGRGALHAWTPAGWRTYRLPEEARASAVTRIVRTQDRLWVATGAGLYTFDGTRFAAFAYGDAPDAPSTNAPVELLYADGDGNLWAGGDTHLVRILDGRVAEITAATAIGGIPGLRSAFEDREGNLWLGSQWEGLTRLWNGWTRRYSVPDGLTDPIVWSVAQDPSGTLWVGGNDGVKRLEVDASGHRVFVPVVPAALLPHPHGYNLLAEPGRLWIGTRGGLRVLDHGAGETVPKALPELAALGGAQINGLLREGRTLWIATPDGLFQFTGARLLRYGRAQGLDDPRVRYLHLGRSGRLYVGTQNGAYERRGGRFVRLGVDSGLPPNLDVTVVRELSDGMLVVGTLAEQMHLFDGRRWRALGSEQGMPTNAPFFLAESNGDLWVAGIRGIARVPLSHLRAFRNGTRTHVAGEMLLNERGDPMAGQQGYCCNGAGTAKGVLVDGVLWLPTRDGVVAMDTHAITKNPMPPGVVVERVDTGDGWRPAWQVAGATLPTGRRDLSVEFTALSFQDPKSTLIRYRLAGYDADWIDADPSVRSARYTNLPPGDYTFEVRGANNAGVWNAASARLAFAIPPRFHETWLFYALGALVLATIVYAGYRLQQHRYRLRQEALEALVQQRTEALEIANHRLEEASQTDPLTGLRNRRYMANQIPQDLAYYDRQMDAGAHAGEVMMFALVDIDHFKSVNDTYGHKAGDRVLQHFAQVLSTLVRSGDYVVRWGGEEFLLVFRPMPTRNLQVIGDRIRAAVREASFDIGTDRPLRLTASVGISEYPLFRDHRVQLGWETMVELADQALYWVKTHGRDGWAAFRPTGTTDLVTLLQDLQDGPDRLVATRRLQLLGSGVPAPVAAS